MIETEALSPDEKLNSLLYLAPAFDQDVPRRLLLRLTTMRVLLYRELAVKTPGKYIANPLADLPNLEADLLPHEYDFYSHVLLGATRRGGFVEDSVSHWTCRMAFSQSIGLREYFLKNELLIFKNKIEAYSNQTDFLLALHQKISRTKARAEALSPSEYEAVISKIKACKPNARFEGKERLIKMPFEMASQAIRQREAYIKGGYAYFDNRALVRVICLAFEESLRRALLELEIKVQNFMQEDKDDQLSSFLKEVTSLNLATEYDGTKLEGKLTARNLEHYVKCFPPCMLNLYNNLKSKHHLKHGGRLQLGLFLKGAGLGLQDAVTWWRKMFEGGGKNFDKEYLYNIKHNYGKEGGKRNYKPMGCELVIKNSDPKAGQYHGCPFKTCGSDLKPLLRQYKLSEDAQREVEENARKRHYQPACQLLFRNSFQTKDEMRIARVGSHPNNFFQEAVAAVEAGQAQKEQAEQKQPS